jgi:hypothetical protein
MRNPAPLLLSAAILLSFSRPLAAGDLPPSDDGRQRLFVLSDIEADPDDTQTFVRLFLYSDVIDIEGLVATTSTHQKSRVAPESIRKLIEAYGKVLPNLKKHDPAYPEKETLLSLVSQGLPAYGMQGVGDGMDSEGSTRLIKALEADDPRPLWVSVWGGANTLAQALYTIRETKSPEEASRLISKLRVYTISDQDDSGIWIRNNFPELFYIVSPGGYGHGTWTGIHTVVDGIDNETISNYWLALHIQQGHGPLGALYPDVAYGMEGDTPAWLSLIPNGLNAPEHPDWGAWGGRYELYRPERASMDPDGFTGGVPVEEETRAFWTNVSDKYTPSVANDFGRAVRAMDNSFEGDRVTLWRWRDDFQNDFAARMDWCVKPYEKANHPPVPVLSHPAELTVHSGEGFVLDASGSSDPDGDNLTYLWFSYPEAGSYKKMIPLSSAQNIHSIYVVAPEVEKPETAHFILKLSDKGIPSLTRYMRVIVTILPKE